TDGAGRPSPSGPGPASRDDAGIARFALPRAGPGLPADGVANGQRACGRAALGRDADRGGRRQGGLVGLSRPSSAGVESPDRSQGGRAWCSGVSAGTHDPAAAGGAQKERWNPGGEARRTAYQAEDTANARPEDGVMLPQVLPMLAVPAAPFDSSEYSFEIK